ncbi:MAG: hypothetical protein GX219_04800 [Tissierellia bacterium]|mgnify:CR=1 FL=1|nr:hypothetical protein [Tissierellia bacterium]
MHAMIKKFVDQEFVKEDWAQFLEDAINKKENIIVAGHRSSGTRNFFASLMAVAKGTFPSVQVKKVDDVAKDCEYLLIPSSGSDDFEQIIEAAVKSPGKAFISLKEPENPWAIKKIMKNVFKENKDPSKVYHMVECRKENDIPFVSKVSTMTMTDTGKIETVDLE